MKPKKLQKLVEPRPRRPRREPKPEETRREPRPKKPKLEVKRPQQELKQVVELKAKPLPKQEVSLDVASRARAYKANAAKS